MSLKAVAAGLGGSAVAAILAALCLNHKHFMGGLPDLLLMRAVQRTGVAHGDPATAGVQRTGAKAVADAEGKHMEFSTVLSKHHSADLVFGSWAWSIFLFRSALCF